jgi:hypothetical protein
MRAASVASLTTIRSGAELLEEPGLEALRGRSRRLRKNLGHVGERHADDAAEPLEVDQRVFNPEALHLHELTVRQAEDVGLLGRPIRAAGAPEPQRGGRAIGDGVGAG